MIKVMKKYIFALCAMAGIAFGAYAGDVPTFPGGDEALKEYIAQNTKYPEHARELGVEGIVSVQFVVLPDGSIGSIKIVRMVDPDLEQEAIRVVKGMPAWNPAEKDGKPVEANAKVDVPFVLE